MVISCYNLNLGNLLQARGFIGSPCYWHKVKYATVNCNCKICNKTPCISISQSIINLFHFCLKLNSYLIAIIKQLNLKFNGRPRSKLKLKFWYFREVVKNWDSYHSTLSILLTGIVSVWLYVFIVWKKNSNELTGWTSWASFVFIFHSWFFCFISC